MPSIHELSDVQSPHIGEGTRIWQYSVILPDAQIGKNCNICAHTLIENQVVLGNEVTIKSGVYLWDGTTIEDGVFIGPNATFSNDKLPRSKAYLAHYSAVLIKRGASVGANATILPGITIGQFAMVGAGAVVTKDVPAFAVVIGNPARIVRFLDKDDSLPRP
jgi:UDP-2-acetamido-3-amino-2,3-dideoxy-glucuronate N-acetyltransferase